MSFLSQPPSVLGLHSLLFPEAAFTLRLGEHQHYLCEGSSPTFQERRTRLQGTQQGNDNGIRILTPDPSLHDFADYNTLVVSYLQGHSSALKPVSLLPGQQLEGVSSGEVLVSCQPLS